MNKLAMREAELSEKIELLTLDAIKKSAVRDIAGAKRKIIERCHCLRERLGFLMGVWEVFFLSSLSLYA
jgi:hypothetical protein